MENKATKKRIIILGCGALGSNLVSSLAIDLRKEVAITVLDYDKVEPRNYQAGTQWYKKDQNGKSKAQMLALNAYYWLNTEVSTIEDVFGNHNAELLKNYDLVVDCFDNYDARKVVYDFCKEHKISCLHIGFSPNKTFEISWNQHYTPPSDNLKGFDICELAGASAFIKMVSSLGSLVIEEYVSSGVQKEFVGNKFVWQEVK